MAFPTTSVLDTFSGTLASWTNPIFGDGAVTITGGQLTGSTGGSNSACWTSTFSTDDQEAYFDIATDTNNQIFLFLMIQNTSSATAYAVESNGAGTLVLRRFNSGANTTLKTSSITIDTGDSFGASFIDNVLSAYRKPSGGSWGLVDSVTDGSPLTGGGKIGLDVEGTAMRLDNFGGGDAVMAETQSYYSTQRRRSSRRAARR